MKEREPASLPWIKNIERQFVPQPSLTSPSLSLIIPTWNCSESIAVTLESVRRQQYSNLELIVVDASSTDRTVALLSNYAALISRIYSVAEYNLPEMMNRAISIASGHYITFLLPGSFYLSSYALALMAEVASQENYPDLLYSGTIQKELKRPAQLIQGPFASGFLATGRVPSTIVAVWFHRDLFAKVGKFDTQYPERTLFDFFCRCSKYKECTTRRVDRVLVDFNYGSFSYGKQARIFKQTWRILLHHFGLRRALLWLKNQLFGGF